jgi:ribosome-associated toxin RatA of RatAB toxin-antitoxin module
MPSIHRHALVSHSARRMYDLVNDVAAYPQRFAWCDAAEVLSSSDTAMVARLELRAAGLRIAFTTRNTLKPPTRIALALEDGPFDSFDGLWTFHSLAEDACKVSLTLEFEVASKLIGAGLALGFQGLADRMVDDFCQAADRSDD